MCPLPPTASSSSPCPSIVHVWQHACCLFMRGFFFLYSEHECGWIDTGSVANGFKISVDVFVNAFAVTALNLSHILAL